jgi:hypothetical protein
VAWPRFVNLLCFENVLFGQLFCHRLRPLAVVEWFRCFSREAIEGRTCMIEE